MVDPIGSSGSGQTPRAGNGGQAILTGREREIAGLRASLQEVLDGSGRSVLLAGEPGIGKTRLVEELAGFAQDGGANVVWGRCWEGEGAPDLWPWIQVIRKCLRAVDEATLRNLVGPHGNELTTLVAQLGAPISDVSHAPASPAVRFRLFNAIAHFLDQYSQLAPLVLILEDLHRADSQSLVLLQFFTQEQRERRMLLVATYREPGAGPNPALTQAVVEAMREPGTERIHLGGLSFEETRALLQALVGFEPPRAFAEGLQRRTGGNPFFLSECARQLAVDDDAAGAPRWPAPEDVIVDAELSELIGQRLAVLSDDDRAVLRCAASLGSPFRDQSLHELCAARNGATAGQAAAALRAAEKLGVLAPAPEPGSYRFAQEMVGEYLAAEIAADEGAPNRQAGAPPAVRPDASVGAVAGSAPNPAASVFRKEGEYWTIAFSGRTSRVKDVKGLAYVALLLRHPGRALHVAELVGHGSASAAATIARASTADGAAELRLGLGDAGQVLDTQAKAEYRRRLGELRAELEQAQSDQDRGRAERAQQEIEFLTDELTAAVGLGGRDRRASSSAERARVNVTRSIARALERIDENHPELARHLRQTIRTGNFCTYACDAAIAARWET